MQIRGLLNLIVNLDGGYYTLMLLTMQTAEYKVNFPIKEIGFIKYRLYYSTSEKETPLSVRSTVITYS